MKIYVAQYQDSGSPTGALVAVSSTFEKAVDVAIQDNAARAEAEGVDAEDLDWVKERHGFYTADGSTGRYEISTWEVAP